MKNTVLISLFSLIPFFVDAQIIEPIKWSFDFNQEGNEAELVFTANIDDGWHLYDTQLPEGGPLPTRVVYSDSSLFEFISPLEKYPEPV
ncbi:MAG: thiol:disulfide interchange protein, partial [Bacteroidales bacterium]|nr:thiol:disulfide interchange protein [Bacteroidales bacterium]